MTITDNTDAPLPDFTADQLEGGIRNAIAARDFKAVEEFLTLLAVKDPHRAQLVYDTLKLGVAIGRERDAAKQLPVFRLPCTDDNAAQLCSAYLLNEGVDIHEPDGRHVPVPTNHPPFAFAVAEVAVEKGFSHDGEAARAATEFAEAHRG